MTTANAAVDKTAGKTGAEKVHEKLAEKRRALGRGLLLTVDGPGGPSLRELTLDGRGRPSLHRMGWRFRRLWTRCRRRLWGGLRMGRWCFGWRLI